MLQGGGIGRDQMNGSPFDDQLGLHYQRQVELLLGVRLVLLVDNANQTRRHNIFFLQSKFTLTCKIEVNQQFRRNFFDLPFFDDHIVRRTLTAGIRQHRLL